MVLLQPLIRLVKERQIVMPSEAKDPSVRLKRNGEILRRAQSDNPLTLSIFL